jgi:hypothetical protein
VIVRWALSGVALALAIVLVWVWPELPTARSTAHDVLSTLAQSLAAVLAIVFALGLMAVEAGNRYAQRVSLLNPVLIAFAVVDSAAVILSLWLLSDPRPDADLVRLAFLLGAAALILLLPLMLGASEQLRPEGVIRRLERAGRAELADSEAATDAQSVVALETVVMSAAAQKDYRTLEVGLTSWASLPVGADTLGRFEEIGHTFIDDPAAVRVVGRAMLRLMPAVDHYDVLASVAKLGRSASRQDHEASARQVVGALRDDALQALERKEEDRVNSAVMALADLGADLARAKHEEACTALAMALSKVTFEYGSTLPLIELVKFAVLTVENELPVAATYATAPVADMAGIDADSAFGFSGPGVVRDGLAQIAEAAIPRSGLGQVARRTIEGLGEAGATGSASDARNALEALDRLWGPAPAAFAWIFAGAVGSIARALAKDLSAYAVEPAELAVDLLRTIGEAEARARPESIPDAHDPLASTARLALRNGYPGLALRALGHLGATTRAAIRTRADMLAVGRPIASLGDIGRVAAETRHGYVVEQVVAELWRIGWAARRDGVDGALDSVVRALEEVAMRAEQGGIDSAAAAARTQARYFDPSR